MRQEGSSPPGDASAQAPAGPTRRGEDEFHNTYHFIPALADSGPAWIGCGTEAFDRGDIGKLSRDRYHAGTRSGRIVCRLTTLSPLVIGAQREAGDENSNTPATVRPYEVGGRPAIPASSLRGCIGSIVEAASNSALRVLADTPLSVRRPMGSALGAIGRLERRGDRWLVRPLTVPAMRFDPLTKLGALPSYWMDILPTPTLPVPVHGYTHDRDGTHPTGFLSKTRPTSSGADNPGDEWEIDVSGRPAWSESRESGAVCVAVEGPKFKSSPRGATLIGQHAHERAVPVRRGGADRAVPPGAIRVRGILRVLGAGPGRSLPPTKKYEVFIPLWDAEESVRRLDATDALQRFHDLADAAFERDAATPYACAGSSRRRDERLRLREGDLVCFRVDEKDPKHERIDELAVSSIWRQDVRNVWAYFARPEADDPHASHLLPFNPSRQFLTPAEEILGFVEHAPAAGRHRGLAGRVRFSLTTCDTPGDDLLLPPVMLKVLGSPKPPSPALYFKPRGRSGGGYIEKSKLNPADHEPHGRKVYAHHPRAHGARMTPAPYEPWRSRSDERNWLKAAVRPIRPGTVFHFHVDFDGLDDAELGLLLYALRPAPKFCHKLGMAKPIGLGSVRIDIRRVVIVDRPARYDATDLFRVARYSEALVGGDDPPSEPSAPPPPAFGAGLLGDADDDTVPASASAMPPDAPSRYAAEFEPSIPVRGRDSGPDVGGLRTALRARLDARIRNAIEVVGDPSKAVCEVTNPLTTNVITPDDASDAEAERCAMERESETYRWFVRNDPKGASAPGERQFLRPIDESDALPTLRWNRW